MTRRDQAKKLFIACGSESDRNIGVIGPVIDQWLDVTEWFVTKAHDLGNTDDDFDEAIVMQNFEVFELTLSDLLGEFFGPGSEELDEILAQANK